MGDASKVVPIFVEFIALIVRNRIYNLLKETMLRLESRQNFLTVPKAIRELEKIEMVRRNSGLYRLDHAVSKKQKIILVYHISSVEKHHILTISLENEISSRLLHPLNVYALILVILFGSDMLFRLVHPLKAL